MGSDLTHHRRCVIILTDHMQNLDFGSAQKQNFDLCLLARKGSVVASSPALYG